MSRNKTEVSLTTCGQLPPTISRAIGSVSKTGTIASFNRSRLRKPKLKIESEETGTTTLKICRVSTSPWRMARILPSLIWGKWTAPWWTKTVHFTMSVLIIRTPLLSRYPKPMTFCKSRRKSWLPDSKKLMLTNRKLLCFWATLSRRVQLDTPKWRQMPSRISSSNQIWSSRSKCLSEWV